MLKLKKIAIEMQKQKLVLEEVKLRKEKLIDAFKTFSQMTNSNPNTNSEMHRTGMSGAIDL